MVLCGVRGCTVYHKGARKKIGVQGMVGHVAGTGVMHYAPDVGLDPYYIPCEPETRSSVCIPLQAPGKVIGVLCVDQKVTHAFSDDQLQVLQALSGHIAAAIENSRRFTHERTERERMQREAEETRLIQQALIRGFSCEPAFDIASPSVVPPLPSKISDDHFYPQRCIRANGVITEAWAASLPFPLAFRAHRSAP